MRVRALRGFVSVAHKARDGRSSVVLAGTELADDDPIVVADPREFVAVDAPAHIRAARQRDIKLTPGGRVPPAGVEWTDRQVRPRGSFHDPVTRFVYVRTDRFDAGDELVRRFPSAFELAPGSD